MRSDAWRNREALVSAAREVFGERGLDAPLDDIARRAGVGNATLYRRFPTRRALVAAVFAERMAQYAQAADDALDVDDPWEGFRRFVAFACDLQVRDRGLADLLTMSVPDQPDLEHLRERAFAGFTALLERARLAGAVREDVGPDDLVLILMANAGLLERTAGLVPGASERLTAFVLAGLRPAGVEVPAPPRTDRRALMRAMVVLARGATGGTRPGHPP